MEAVYENTDALEATTGEAAAAGSFYRILRRLLPLGLFVVPFLSALEFFQPATHNYTAYFALLALPAGLLGLALSRKRVGVDFALLLIVWIVLNTGLIRGWDVLLGDYNFFVYPFTAFGLYLAARYVMEDQDLVLFLRLLVLFAVLEAALAMLQSYMEWPLFTEVIPQFYAEERNYFAYILPGISKYVIQGTGTFEHFNGLGALVALAFPIAYSLWVSDKSNLMRLLSVITIGGGVIATFSRGALLGAILATAIVWASSQSKKVIVMVAIGACLASALSMSTFSKYFAETENLTVRTSTWDLATEYASNHPEQVFFGFGYRFFRSEVLGEAGTMMDMHSGPIQILLELGVFGFVLFVGVVLGPIRALMRSGPVDKVVPVTLFSGCIGFLVQQFFDNAMFTPTTGVLFIMLIALGARPELFNSTAVKRWWLNTEQPAGTEEISTRISS